MSPRSCKPTLARRMRLRTMLTLPILLLPMADALAGVGGAAVPAFPNVVHVGDTFSGTLTITNFSSGIPLNADDTIAATGIFLTPSCANGVGTCALPDTGVFAVTNPMNAGDPNATACITNTFTVSAPDASGTVQFIPNTTVVLGPSINGTGGAGNLAGSRCKIKFTVHVVKLPATDADGALAGIQTLALARVGLLQDQQSPLDTGQATGGMEVSVALGSPVLTGAKSRKVQGTAGTFDLPLTP